MKRKAIEKLLNNSIRHEEREYDKNLFARGVVSKNDIIQIFLYSRGDQHSTSGHYFLEGVTVHIIRAVGKYDGYYVKFYFVEPDIWFISVHQ